MNNYDWYAVIDSYKEILGIFPTYGEAENFMDIWNEDSRKIGDVSNEAQSIKHVVLEFDAHHFG